MYGHKETLQQEKINSDFTLYKKEGVLLRIDLGLSYSGVI